jgi:hypothetical protein
MICNHGRRTSGKQELAAGALAVWAGTTATLELKKAAR